MARGLDIGISAFLVLGSVAVYIESLDLPPPVYDPIGPAAFPRALSVTVGVLALVIMIIAIRGPAPAASINREGRSLWPTRFNLVLGTALATTGYFALLAFRPFSFGIVTTLYLTFQVMLLFRFEFRRLPVAVVVAVVVGFGCDYIFTQFFFIDLP